MAVPLLPLKEQGAAIFMATHDLFRAKETGTRIGIMREGQLVQEMRSDDVSHSDLERIYLEQMHIQMTFYAWRKRLNSKARMRLLPSKKPSFVVVSLPPISTDIGGFDLPIHGSDLRRSDS